MPMNKITVIFSLDEQPISDDNKENSSASNDLSGFKASKFSFRLEN